MNLYRLHAQIGIMPVLEYNFEFVANDDGDARLLVEAFYRVCRPRTHGPLERIGEEDVRNGIKAIYRDDTKAQAVPLTIILDKDPPRIESGSPASYGPPPRSKR